MTAKNESQLEIVQKEFSKELKKPAVINALLQTTFKGFSQPLMEKAIFEGMTRGFTFKNFLQKDVYAIPYGSGYSLVTSIDYCRKIAMRSGLAGKSEPLYEEAKDGGNPIACSVTIKRNVAGVIGDYTAKVYFKEFTTGRNLWTSKPRNMIAKVAEMHALRSAFPEEMAQAYVEEEFEKETETRPAEEKIEEYKAKLNGAKTLEELGMIYSSLPVQVKAELKALKDILKVELTNHENSKISKQGGVDVSKNGKDNGDKA